MPSISPRPGNRDGMVYPNPGMTGPRTRKPRKPDVRIGLPKKPRNGRGGVVRPLPIDEKIVRTMPITEKQLGQIKKMYGI